ncbi:MAG: type II toxin-antitoxin system PemK/MazF family toxin [Armatimonadetes bacterium]|nr:type II toxin-antitoxin system PemK/MazF family toxin [Armatimonadota bacterium]
MIQQGDLFWVDFGIPTDSEPGFLRPVVVLQNDRFNAGRLRTIIVASLTTNLRRAQDPNNILLEVSEGNLPEQSVVVVSQLYTFNKSEMTDAIGKLSPRRVRQILDGLSGLLEPTDTDTETVD